MSAKGCNQGRSNYLAEQLPLGPEAVAEAVMSPRLICLPAPEAPLQLCQPPLLEPSLGLGPPDICGTCIPETFRPWGICLEQGGCKSHWESDGIWAMEAGPQAEGRGCRRRGTCGAASYPRKTHRPAAVVPGPFTAGAQPPPSQAFSHGPQLPYALSFCPPLPVLSLSPSPPLCAAGSFSLSGLPKLPAQHSPAVIPS